MTFFPVCEWVVHQGFVVSSFDTQCGDSRSRSDGSINTKPKPLQFYENWLLGKFLEIVPFGCATEQMWRRCTDYGCRQRDDGRRDEDGRRDKETRRYREQWSPFLSISLRDDRHGVSDRSAETRGTFPRKSVALKLLSPGAGKFYSLLLRIGIHRICNNTQGRYRVLYAYSSFW